MSLPPSVFMPADIPAHSKPLGMLNFEYINWSFFKVIGGSIKMIFRGLGNKKSPPVTGGLCIRSIQRLTLGELEALARTRLTRFFTFFHTGITAQEAGFLENGLH